MITLRDYQIPSVVNALRSLRKHGCYLDAGEMGTGKTPKASVVARDLQLPVGVICPLAVIPTWHRWLKEAGVIPQFVMNYEKLRTGKTAYGRWETVTVGRQLVRGKIVPILEERFVWNLEPRHTLIFDEVHYCKGAESQNGELLSGAKKHAVLMISATPMENPLDMRHTGYILDLHSGGRKDFYQFAVNYGARPRHPRARDLVFWKNDDELVRLKSNIFPEKGDAITVKELGDRFPKNQIICQTYEIPELRDAYREIELSLERLKEKEKLDNPEDAFTWRTRARQRAEFLRIPLMCDMARDAKANRKSAVLFFNFRESCELAVQFLQAELIYGGLSRGDINEALSRFQLNDNPFLVCQFQAGGIGMDMHDLHNRPRITLHSPTDSPVLMRQALGRTPRDGALSPSLQYIILAAGTIEQRVCDNVNRKLHNLDTLTREDLETI